MHQNDKNTLTDMWLEETNQLNKKIDESLKNAQDIAYQLGVQRSERNVRVLEAAIIKTLNENAHLADGDVCTLIDLKKSLADIGKPWQMPSDV